MAFPLPDIGGLVDDLNALRKRGVVLTNEFRIKGLKKRIAVLRARNPGAAACFQASLWSLTGNVEEVLSSVDSWVRCNGVAGKEVINHVTSLCAAGMFSHARELFEKIDEQTLSDDYDLLVRGWQCLSAGKVVRLAATRDYANRNRVMNLSVVHDIFERAGVDEPAVTRMLDLAGSVLHTHGLLHCLEPRITPYRSHGTVTISLPVMVDAHDVAELEWEFCNRLFSEYPDAPVHVAHVGFCVGDVRDNA